MMLELKGLEKNYFKTFGPRNTGPMYCCMYCMYSTMLHRRRKKFQLKMKLTIIIMIERNCNHQTDGEFSIAIFILAKK